MKHWVDIIFLSTSQDVTFLSKIFDFDIFSCIVFFLESLKQIIVCQSGIVDINIYKYSASSCVFKTILLSKIRAL